MGNSWQNFKNSCLVCSSKSFLCSPLIANTISILYGGSVKATNAGDIFAQPDVDGGLVGGASLVAADFAAIINSLKK